MTETITHETAKQFDSLSNFKHSVYDKHGSGSWLDDMKLEIVYREAHNEPIPDYLEPLINDE